MLAQEERHREAVLVLMFTTFVDVVRLAKGVAARNDENFKILRGPVAIAPTYREGNGAGWRGAVTLQRLSLY